MKNLDPVYAVTVYDHLLTYGSEDIRDRVYDQFSQSGCKVAKINYKVGTLDRSHVDHIPGVRFGNPALQRGAKPGVYGG